MGVASAQTAGAALAPLQEFSQLGVPEVEPGPVEWYAAYTNSKYEKLVAKQLEERRVRCFLPLYRSWRCWADRRKQIELALFPGYVFVHIALRERLRVLELPGVVHLVGAGGRPTPLPASEIEGLREGLAHGVYAEPHPYLRAGNKVRVVRGPLAGTEGRLVRRKEPQKENEKESFRFVLSLDVLMRSVAVELDATDVEPTG